MQRSRQSFKQSSKQSLKQNLKTIRILLRCFGAGALVVVLCSPVHANGPSAAYPRGSATWMPDVRERILDLRERARRAADEARIRRHDNAGRGQWWRAVAARPMQQVAR